MKDKEITLERVKELFSEKEWAKLQQEDLFSQLEEIRDRVGNNMINGSVDEEKMFKVFQEEIEKFECIYIDTKSEDDRREYFWILDAINK